MNTTQHNTRRLKKRAWLQRQAILVLETQPESITAKEILHLIRANNASPTLRGWCEASSVAMGMILRQIVSYGLIKRSKMPCGSFCYSKIENLDGDKFNEYFGDRGLHPKHRV